MSYLTIENKGSIPREFRPKVGDWIFGCDLCQEVCPFNARAAATRWPEFQPSKGVGPWISLEDLLGLPDEAAFRRRFDGTPIRRAKRRGMLRNACVVAGNSGERSLVSAIVRVSDDEDPIIREHALWALGRLDPSVARDRARRRRAVETDAAVLSEIEAVA